MKWLLVRLVPERFWLWLALDTAFGAKVIERVARDHETSEDEIRVILHDVRERR